MTSIEIPVAMPKQRTRAAVLADDWCRDQVSQFQSFLVCVEPSARPRIEPVITEDSP